MEEPEKPAEEAWISAEEAAKRLNCQRKDVIKMIFDKKLIAKMPLGQFCWIINPQSVERIIEDETGGPVLRKPPAAKDASGSKTVNPRVDRPRPNISGWGSPPKKFPVKRETIVRIGRCVEGCTVGDVAASLHLSPKSIDSWIQGFKIDIIIIGGERYIDPNSLKSFLESPRSETRVEFFEKATPQTV